MQSPSQKPVPNEEMTTLLAQLAQEDADIPDPMLLPASQAREIATLINRRWNLDLPAMAQVDDISFESPEGHDIPARLFTPKDVEPGLIFFIHGGGFVHGSIDTHENIARGLAIQSKCAVLSIGYRLAPEYPFPAGLNDCIAAFRQVEQVREAYDWTNGPIAVSGDSAGANLSMSLMLHEQANGKTMPDFAMLFYGVYSADFQTHSYVEHSEGPGLTRAKMERYLDWYAPENERKNPLVAALNASDDSLKTLPPLYLTAAEIDPLHSDTAILVERLRGLGRKDQLQIFKGVVHGFLHMTSRLSTAREATTAAAEAFRNFTQT